METLTQILAALSPWELLAVILALAYLLLAMVESLWCWLCALISTAIYTVLFWDVSLLMEAALNVYYMAMAVYGWWQWRYGGVQQQGATIHRLSTWQHIAIVGLVLLLSAASGYWLANNTGAAWPYLDSITTWGSVITTVLVARKVLENWLYWMVIDGLAIVLYVDKALYLTAILYGAYIIIALFGYRRWRGLCEPV